jgi:hypothetical protein
MCTMPPHRGDEQAVSNLSSKIWGKAKELDQKHHIVSRVKKSTESTVDAAKEFDKKYHVVDGAKQVAVTAGQKASAMNQQYVNNISATS